MSRPEDSGIRVGGSRAKGNVVHRPRERAPGAGKDPASGLWRWVMETTLPVSILFGDGDLAATRPLRVDLRRRGAVVNLAQTASEVLRQTAVQVPALLVLDDALKQSGEIDVLSHFGASHPGTKTILLYSGGDAPPQ